VSSDFDPGIVSFLEFTQYTSEGTKRGCRNFWVAFTNERGVNVSWNLGTIAHLRAASRLNIDCHGELAVYEWIGPSVVCDGRVTPKLFLAYIFRSATYELDPR